MNHEAHRQLLTKREAAIAYNEGLKTAAHLLEIAETLTSEGRRYLLEELKKRIAENEPEYMAQLRRYASWDLRAENFRKRLM